MSMHGLLGGMGALLRDRLYVSMRHRTSDAMTPAARRELDGEIAELARAIDRRLDRDGSYGQDVLLRRDGQDMSITPATLGMCTVVTGEGFLAADIVLADDVVVDLNGLESGSVEVYADTVAFRLADGTRIEIVTLPGRPTIQ